METIWGQLEIASGPTPRRIEYPIVLQAKVYYFKFTSLVPTTVPLVICYVLNLTIFGFEF